MDLLCRRALGTRGAYLSSFVLGFTQIGWFGVVVAMFTIPTAELLGINAWWLTIAAGLLMTATAATGMKALEIVSTVSVPLIMVLGGYSMALAATEGGPFCCIQSVGRSDYAVYRYRIRNWFFYFRGDCDTEFYQVCQGAEMRRCGRRQLPSFWGITLMFCFGAVGGAYVGKDDIFYVMIAQGLAVPAIIVLGANIWTTNNNALYTGGLALSNIFGIRMKVTAGIAGTALAIWLYWNFVGWLAILKCALPPVGIIVILDYFRNRSRYAASYKPVPVNWYNAGGIVIGGVSANLIPWGIAAVNAMAVAELCFFIGELAEGRRRNS